MRMLAVVCAFGLSVYSPWSDVDMTSLENKFGVGIDQHVLGYTVTTYVHGSYPKLAEGFGHPAFEQMASILEDLRRKKIRELENSFGISIKMHGTTTQKSCTSLFMTSASLPVRLPNLCELANLEYALEHSYPSQFTGRSESSRGVNIYFLDKKSDTASSEWGFDGHGVPSLFLERRFGLVEGRTTEESLMHQLAHNSQYRMGWDPHFNMTWPVAKELGWIFSGETHIKDITFQGHPIRKYPEAAAWLLRTREGDDFTYKYNQEGRNWIRSDKNLRTLDASGKPVGEEKAKTLSFDQMRELAVVPPVSPEFVNPSEVFADAMAMFRADQHSRAELLRESPRLYFVVKEQDQKELDWTFGKGKMVRSVNGIVTEPTPQVLKEIRELEHGKAA